MNDFNFVPKNKSCLLFLGSYLDSSYLVLNSNKFLMVVWSWVKDYGKYTYRNSCVGILSDST